MRDKKFEAKVKKVLVMTRWFGYGDYGVQLTQLGKPNPDYGEPNEPRS